VSQRTPTSVPTDAALSVTPSVPSVESGVTAMQKKYQAEIQQQMKQQVESLKVEDWHNGSMVSK